MGSPKTHKRISTGQKDNKFGINFSEINEISNKIKKLKNINFIGLHFHIGSQITDLDVFRELAEKVNYISEKFENLGFNIEYLNLGGGLGIDYHQPDKNNIPNFEEFFEVFNSKLKKRENQSVHFELGRSIVGQCGNLLTKVLYTKKNNKTSFIIVDAGFTELMRPVLYNAYHSIENLSSNKNKRDYTIAGPICESTDLFAEKIRFPETKRGDFITIKSAGAYGEVMKSSYNLRYEMFRYYF